MADCAVLATLTDRALDIHRVSQLARRFATNRCASKGRKTKRYTTGAGYNCLNVCSARFTVSCSPAPVRSGHTAFYLAIMHTIQSNRQRTVTLQVTSDRR